MPKISVIVTVHDDEAYLGRCLDSLLSQTLRSLEFIIIDDASSDDSLKIIKKYAKKDRRITTVLLPENAGISSARNAGLKLASSDYIMFCDGDDYYDEKMCEKMLTSIEKSSADLAICKIKLHYDAHKEMKSSDDAYYSLKYRNIKELSPEVIRSIDSSVDNKIFRRSLIERYSITFPKGITVGEDAFFVLAYLFASQKAYFLNEELYHYIRHAGSLMSNNWKKQSKFSLDHIELFIRLHAFLLNKKLLNTPADYELFWSYFREYIFAAHRWCPDRSTRKQLRQKIHTFLKKHQPEISKNVSPATRRKLKYQDSSFYYSHLWRFIKNHDIMRT